MPTLDGLRAVAVVAVVLFHLGLPGTDGGYAGVDVFFVLSGFLITSILLRQHLEKRFSIRGFYVNRFWRLFPALLVTTLVTLIGCAVMFSPYLFEPLSQSALAAVLSSSNFYFWMQSGYFDADAITKPLLHTWSLGVEEQFYLMWPLVAVAIARLRRRLNRVCLVVGLGLASIVACELWLQENPNAVFYLMPFRIFEFATGALIVLIRDRITVRGRLASVILVVSLLVLGACFHLLSERSPFPGAIALLPCMATALIIGTAEDSSVRWLLANKPMVYLGRLSYSIYLVHWPVITIASYWFVGDRSPYLPLAMILAIWVLSHGLHSFVEVAFRNGPAPESRIRRPVVATLLIFTLGICVPVLFLGDIPGRYDAKLSPQSIRVAKSHRFRDLKEHCRIDSVDGGDCFGAMDTVVFVIGNSHEPDAVNILDGLFEGRSDIRLVFFGTTNSCRFDISGGRVRALTANPACESRVAVLNSPGFVRRLDHVVYSARYVFAENKLGFLDLLAYLKELNPGLQLTVFGDYIYTKVDCAELINRYGNSGACRHSEFVANVHGLLQDQGPLLTRFESLGARVVSKWSLLCGRTLSTCKTETPNGFPMFYDKHHLSYEFARYLGRLMRESGYDRMFKRRAGSMSRILQRRARRPDRRMFWCGSPQLETLDACSGLIGAAVELPAGSRLLAVAEARGPGHPRWLPDT